MWAEGHDRFLLFWNHFPTAYTDPKLVDVFLNILECQAKSRRCSPLLIEACSSFCQHYPAALDGATIDRPLASSLECLQRVIHHSEESFQALVAVCLLRAMARRGDVGALQRSAVDSLVQLSGLRTDTFALLKLLFAGDCPAMGVQVVKAHGWPGASPCIVALLAHMKDAEQEAVLESLGDHLTTTSDAHLYLDLIRGRMHNTKLLLAIHDFLSGLGYPPGELFDGFVEALRVDVARVIASGTAATLGWVFSSYAVSIERFLQQTMKKAGSHESLKLAAIVQLLKVLVATGLVDKPLKTLVLLISQRKSLVSMEFIEAVGGADPAEDRIKGVAIELWKSCCKCAIENGDLLSAVFRVLGDSQDKPWMLDSCLRPCFDPRSEIFAPSSEFWIPGMQRFIEGLLSRDPPLRDVATREEINHFYLALLSALRSPPMGVKGERTQALIVGRLEELVRLLASSCLYLVAFGDKKWSYYLAEFSHASRWLSQPGRIHHETIPSLFLSYVLDRIHDQRSVQELFQEQRPHILSHLLIEYILGGCRFLERHLGLIAGNEAPRTYDRPEFSVFLINEGATVQQNTSLWTRARDICQATLARRLLALGSRHRERCAFMEIVLAFFHGESSPAAWTCHLLQVASETLTYSMRIIASLATHVLRSQSQLLVDALDSYLYSLCSQIARIEEEGRGEAPRNVGMFILNRLTSIFIARGDAVGIESEMTRALIETSLQGIGAAELHQYLNDLLLVLRRNRFAFFDAFRRHLFLAIISSRGLVSSVSLNLLCELLPEKWRINASQLAQPLERGADLGMSVVELSLSRPHPSVGAMRLPLRLAKALMQGGPRHGPVAAFNIVQSWRGQVRSVCISDDATHDGLDLIIADEGLVFACLENHPLCNIMLD